MSKKRNMRLTSIGILLLLVAGAAAENRQAERYAKQGGKLQAQTKELWKRFVFEHRKLTDKELGKIVKSYEKAVDLYQKSMEEEEQAALNSAILTLAKRIAQARMVQTAREFAKRPKKTPAAPTPPAPKPPTPENPAPPKPEPAPPPVEAEPEPTPPPELSVLPELREPKAAQRRGMQGVRNFVMHYYFAHRKYAALITRCHLCNGTGRRKTNQLDRRRKIITTACTTCNESGGYLNVPAVRKGWWLCWSPLYRSNEEKRSDWQARLDLWKEDPSKVDEFLKTLRILKVDYHGLWAEVTWSEKATKAGSRQVIQRKITRKVVRAGKRWFFYDEKLDEHFFN